MVRPTAAEVRANTRINPFLVANGFPTASPDTALTDEITLAWAYVEKRTCRDLDALDPLDPANEADIIIARRAVMLRLIQQTIIEGTDFLTGALDDLIKSFAVPGYSETRADGIRSIQDNWRLNSLPALHDLLRILISDECWDQWIADSQGPDQEAPFSTITEFDWLSLPYRNPTAP